MLHVRGSGDCTRVSMKTLRFLTLNLWGAEPPLEQRMALLIHHVRELSPDVIALQEVRESSRLPNQGETLAKALGMTCSFASATPIADGHEGLAILSRVPVVEKHALELPHAVPTERRILLSVALPFEKTVLWAHTTHLNYRLTHGKQREDQVVAIEASVSGRASDAPQVLMGDMNARPDADEIRFLRGLTTLSGRRTYFQDAWERRHAGDAGFTWACANPYTAKLAFLEPDRRIDYIFVTPMRGDGRGTVRSCERVFDRPDSNGVYVSDHFGLLAEIQVEPT
jgi:endonuclease/exonuclease/phosphatase family metal-dependent hydrolase